MKLYIVSLQNALILIALSFWGYFSSESPSVTAFIPIVIGVIFILLNKGVKRNHQMTVNIAFFLTIVVLLGLIMPLLGAMDRDNCMAIMRILVMILSTVMAVVFFSKRFFNRLKK